MKPLASASVRTRLTVWYVAFLAGILLIYVASVVAFQYGMLRRQIFHDEIQDVETVEGLLFFDSYGHLQLEQSYHSHMQSRLLADRLMEVRGLSGTLLYQTDTLNGMDLGGPMLPSEGDGTYNERLVRLADGSHAFMISHLHPIQGQLVLIRLAYGLSPMRDSLLQFLIVLVVALPLTLLVAGFAGHSIARRALIPLQTMAARAQQISASNLSDRLLLANPNDELGHMGQVFNRLLDRLEQAFAQLRQRFTADAAHELRTPLASLRTAGEVALQNPKSAETYRDAISTMLEETVRLNQTIDGLLMLSKAEATHGGGATSSFLLREVVDEIIALLEVVIDDRNITIQQEGELPGGGAILADRSLIRVALLNVLHNAVKFSDRDSVLYIQYGRAMAEGVEFEQICIQNSGPPIPTGEHERLFVRFYTGTSTATAGRTGAGLGLSIAKLVVERSGGRISFDEAVSTGARCLITLPIASRKAESATTVY